MKFIWNLAFQPFSSNPNFWHPSLLLSREHTYGNNCISIDNVRYFWMQDQVVITAMTQTIYFVAFSIWIENIPFNYLFFIRVYSASLILLLGSQKIDRLIRYSNFLQFLIKLKTNFQSYETTKLNFYKPHICHVFKNRIKTHSRIFVPFFQATCIYYCCSLFLCLCVVCR